eukprot:8288084-Pyramimonas_sp.AAC.1
MHPCAAFAARSGVTLAQTAAKAAVCLGHLIDLTPFLSAQCQICSLPSETETWDRSHLCCHRWRPSMSAGFPSHGGVRSRLVGSPRSATK